uniref:NEDD8-activating enzyme E1 regulatory subunit isoform X2 n=1 Tax=Myxine glutinosa TaxID=7769 RepID=UPI00358EEBE6
MFKGDESAHSFPRLIMATNVPVPLTNKDQRYDRQLRLWGDHGQRTLELAHVCVIHASATGTELLKNLVLPGVGAFTIVDDKTVIGADIGNNFFLTSDSIGKNRARAALELIKELNGDVSGSCVEKSVEELLEREPDFFHHFSVVVATQLPERPLLRLAEELWNSQIPLLVCRTYGILGYLRLAVPEHTVVESHPDNTLVDLRLDKPFPRLAALLIEGASRLRLAEHQEHSHIPWLIIVAEFLQRWRVQHNGKLPSSYMEKDAFRNLIKEGMWSDGTSAYRTEENFEEAARHAASAILLTQVPREVEELFSDDCCENPNSNSTDFWICLHALKGFVENEGGGTLPVRGSLPDMIADSASYLALQAVYRDKALEDVAAVAKRVAELLLQIGRTADAISEQAIRLFCKNAAFLRLVRCRSLAVEYDPKTASRDFLGVEDSCVSEDLGLYLMLRSVDRFFIQHGRFPGERMEHNEPDVVLLHAEASSLLQEWDLPTSPPRNMLVEFCRCAMSELHPVAAFVGGAGAQEVIKLLTKQFVPIDNTVLYNAVTQSAVTLRL